MPPQLNYIHLAGEIMTEPGWRICKNGQPVSYFKLLTLRTWNKKVVSRTWIWVNVYGASAGPVRKLKRVGDHVIVTGSLEQRRFEGRTGARWFHFVKADAVTFLWPSPKTFTRGHVLVPKDEVARYKKLMADPLYIPPEVVEDLEDATPPDEENW